MKRVQIDPDQWPVLSKLLDEALELSPEARESWLDALPETHAALKATLQQLLVEGTSANSDGASPSPTLVAGTAVGPYIIEEEIGRGGMGAVWRARRSDGVIKRPVALKLPHAGLYGPDLIDRFVRERDILAELTHPNIARLYDAGFGSGGQPFLALEYVPGQPLTRYCDEQRLDVAQRLKLFQQVLGAVQYAHTHLVVHRDIKPSNVIVGPDGQAMLLDFGIAKLRGGDAADEAKRTQFEPALTPDYASPEQIAEQPVTTTSDVYSLGVLLFELLTGQRPYRLTRNSRGELEEAILHTEPPRPSQAIRKEVAAAARATTAKSLSNALRGDLDTIILKALKKNPADRYPTADAFSQDIERYLRGEPVAARPDGGWYRARKFIARHRLPVAASAVALIAIVATAAVALFEAHNAAAERDRALALSSRNEAVTEFLNTLITEAAGADRPVTVSDMLARSEALVSVEYQDDPEHRAAVLGMLGIYYHTIADDMGAEALLQRALDAVRTSSDGDLRRKLTCDHAIAVAGLGKLDDAKRALNAVIADPATATRQSADCLEYLAYMAQDANDAADALKYANLALERLREDKHPPAATEAAFLGSVGYAEHLNGRNDSAEKFYQQAVAEFVRAGRDHGADAISVRNNWAIVSDGAGTPRRSLELYDQTLKLVAETDPGAAPAPYLVANRAHALDSLGRFGEARSAFTQCLSQVEKRESLGFHSFCLLGLATVSRELGDLPTAGDYLDKTAALLGAAAVPPAHPAVITLHGERGRLEMAKGSLAEARTELETALTHAKSASATSATLITRAELNLREGKLPAAEADVRRVLSIVQAAQGGIPYSNRTGLAWLMLGRVLAKEGDASHAREAFAAAVSNLSNTVDADHPMLMQARLLALN